MPLFLVPSRIMLLSKVGRVYGKAVGELSAVIAFLTPNPNPKSYIILR